MSAPNRWLQVCSLCRGLHLVERGEDVLWCPVYAPVQAAQQAEQRARNDD